MENNPFQNNSERGSKGSEKKSGDAPFAYQPAVERPAYQPLEQYQERAVPRVPTEGIISWRDRDEVRERETVEANKSEKEKDEDKTKPGVKPAQPVYQPPVEVTAPVEQPVSPFPELTEYVEAKAEEEEASEAEPRVYPQFRPQPETPQPHPSYQAEDAPQQLPAVERPILPVEYTEQPLVPAHVSSGAETVPPAGAEYHYTPPELTNAQFVPVQAGEAPLPVAAGEYQPPVAEAPMPLPQPAERPYAPLTHEQPIWPGQPEGAPVPPSAGEFAAYPDAGPVPPATAEVPHFANTPPEQPDYAHGYDPYNNPALPNVEHAPAAYGNVHAMPIEHPRSAVTTNRDPRVGPVAALLGLEYFGRKRADRKLERRMNQRLAQTSKEQNQQQHAEHQRLAEQQRQLGAEQQRVAGELHGLQFRTPDQYAATAPAAPVAAERPMAMSSAPEVRRAETYLGAMPPRAETHPAAPEQAEQPNADESQQFELQPGQHVEHSSWHNIVVDRRGHEVTGAIEYGEGFQRERQQEARPEPIVTTDAAGAASDNSMMGGQYQPTYPSALPSGMTMPSLPQGQPTHADPNHQLPARGERNPAASNLTNPWFWIMLLLIIAAFFTAAMV